MTEAIEITGLRRVRVQKPNRGGSTIIAHFDCEARGLAFGSCCLVRTSKGGLVAWLPRLDGPDGERRFVTFTDDSLRHAIMLHAREAYRALGGTDAEWIGKSIPMGPHPVNDQDQPAEGAVRWTTLNEVFAPLNEAALAQENSKRG